MALKVVELFAGVGGFRIGLEGYPKNDNSPYKVVWSNQWEPSTKIQHASLVYENRFGKNNHSGIDIGKVETIEIPDHDLLVGGFPCQDYSVATTLKKSGGLIGKKGVLWWQIHRIIEEKDSKKPKYLIFENVDRLVNSPATQRGRDFAMILSSLNQLGYAVEWKIINAADYGLPQRRRRIYIIGYHNSTAIYQKIKSLKYKEDWITKEGVHINAFPSRCKNNNIIIESIADDLVEVSNNFNKGKKLSPFQNTGIMIDGKFWTCKMESSYSGKSMTIEDILVPLEEVQSEYLINDDSLDKWKYLKGSKKEQRHNKAKDFYYNYAEGSMVFPDDIKKPSRTIITGEGGSSPSRFKHVVQQNGILRRLTPVELERLNMFPDNHTQLNGITDTKRAFFMGNALVVGIVEKIGKELFKNIQNG